MVPIRPSWTVGIFYFTLPQIEAEHRPGALIYVSNTVGSREMDIMDRGTGSGKREYL